MRAKVQPAPKVPKKFSGRWIAWNHALTKIVATGTTFDEALDAAVKLGEPKPFLAKAPRGPINSPGVRTEILRSGQ